MTECSGERSHAIADQGTERLGILALEMRNLLNTATLAFETIKGGCFVPGRNTGLVLGRSLMGLRDLIDRSLADVRLEAGAGIEHFERISVAEFIEDDRNRRLPSDARTRSPL